MTVYSGKCLCGQVQMTVHDEPLYVGICHCTDCRRESGSAFTFFGVWSADKFRSEGDTSMFSGRSFCIRCGSRVFAVNEKKAEMKLGILSEAPSPWRPSFEVWVKRREPWLRPVEGAEQYQEDRD